MAGNPLFIGYTAAVYFHTCDVKINSWTTQDERLIVSKIRGARDLENARSGGSGKHDTGVGRWQKR